MLQIKNNQSIQNSTQTFFSKTMQRQQTSSDSHSKPQNQRKRPIPGKNSLKKKPAKIFRKGENNRRLKWDLKENQKYCIFIQEFQHILLQRYKRDKQRIYNRMEDHIGSRNSSQCKSHHQKLFKKHLSIQKIVETLCPDLLEKISIKSQDSLYSNESEKIQIQHGRELQQSLQSQKSSGQPSRIDQRSSELINRENIKKQHLNKDYEEQNQESMNSFNYSEYSEEINCSEDEI